MLARARAGQEIVSPIEEFLTETGMAHYDYHVGHLRMERTESSEQRKAPLLRLPSLP